MRKQHVLALLMLAVSLAFLTSCTGYHVAHSRSVVSTRVDRDYYEWDERRQGIPPWAPAHGYRRQQSYYYYPAGEFYYHHVRRQYFWVDGGHWRFGATLPSRLRVYLSGPRVSVRLEGHNPAPYHWRVREYYRKPSPYRSESRYGDRDRYDRDRPPYRPPARDDRDRWDRDDRNRWDRDDRDRRDRDDPDRRDRVPDRGRDRGRR